MTKFKEFAVKFGAPAIALVAPMFAFAQMTQPPGGVVAPGNINSINQITSSSGIICVLINWAFWLLLVLTIVFVIWAAFLYLTAAGDPEKVKAAGHTLLYAAVAIIVGLIAKGLPLIVSSLIGGGLSGTGC
jgi:magnesium-transporting ATPase (P-type)